MISEFRLRRLGRRRSMPRLTRNPRSKQWRRVEFRPEVIVTKAEPRSASTARAATPIRPAKTIETASKPQHNEPDKTFFNLWFDMVIGRKR